MKRATPGETSSLVYTIPTTSGGDSYAVVVYDWKGRNIKASVEANGTTATVGIEPGVWFDGRPGIGRIEIMRDRGGAKTAVISERLRIMPGIAEERANTLYADYGLGW